jgi:hypothetical protein
MVVYSTYLEKENKNRSIMCADMTDKDSLMIVTLTIPTQLVQKHAEKILPGNGISITNFNIFPKTVYDRGDCDRIISLNETSIVEKIHTICLEYHFVSDTTISQLAQSKDIYPIRTIGAVITLARKLGSQHILHIKDGESDATRQWYHSPYPVLSFSFACPCISVKLRKYCIVPCCICNCSILIQICFHQWNNNCLKRNFHLFSSKT